MKQSYAIINLLFSALWYSSVQAQPDWTLLLYADPCADVAEAAFKNITDLVRSYDSDEISIYVQLQVFLQKNPDKSFAWRYAVKNKSLVYIDTVKIEDDPVTNFTNAVDWAFGAQTSTYHCIIISGHGSGILEPQYNQQDHAFSLEYDQSALCAICSKQKNPDAHRSILLNDFNGNSIDNAMMIDMMAYTKDLLQKKIDFLGFNLCLGASIEHAYQLAPYVNYFVGCQNCALIDGFDYYTIGKTLQTADCTPENLAEDIVTSYKTYYDTIAPESRYAISAFNLQQMDHLTECLNDFVLNLMNLMMQNPSLIEQVIAIRKKSFHACFVPTYTDLYDFAEKIQTDLVPQLRGDDKDILERSVENLFHAIKKTIAAEVHGHTLKNIHGMNIYYPYTTIETSYKTTPFAQNTHWLTFLLFMTDHYAQLQ